MKKVEKLDRKNILIVDDNKENRFLMKILLKKHGAVIDEAVNGKEAIDKILAKQYDVILMDIQMPIMDGYEATIKIREMEKNKIISKNTIIAVSAYCLKEDVKKAMDTGCDFHIDKPIVRDVFLEQVSSFL